MFMLRTKCVYTQCVTKQKIDYYMKQSLNRVRFEN